MHLDSEKRNRKLGLRAEVKLTTFVRTENWVTENLFRVLTFLICGQKVRLDSEKRNRKLGLRAEVKLTTFVQTENCQTENCF